MILNSSQSKQPVLLVHLNFDIVAMLDKLLQKPKMVSNILSRCDIIARIDGKRAQVGKRNYGIHNGQLEVIFVDVPSIYSTLTRSISQSPTNLSATTESPVAE